MNRKVSSNQFSRISWISLGIGGVFILLITLPYIYAYTKAGPNYVFEGFLVNPIDGNSYLAKIYQGWEGNWRFTLPYTSNAGEGAYINLFYLFLGHLSRILSFSPILTYHLARIATSIIMLIAINYFFIALKLHNELRSLALGLAAFGSGLGWVGLFSGLTTSDFWVSETYPFLSAFTNPHFPLGMALLLWIVTPSKQEVNTEISIPLSFLERGKVSWGIGLASLILAVISPFGVIITLTIMMGMILWNIGVLSGQGGLVSYVNHLWKSLPIPNNEYQVITRDLKKVFWVSISSGPVLIYYMWVTRSNPQLAGWNQQNLTPSPPVWDLALSLSPAILFALGGIWYTGVKGEGSKRLLVVWLVLTLVLLYIPFGLQRRFMLGLYIPVVGLAMIGLWQVASGKPNKLRFLGALLFLLSLPTNFLLLAISTQGISSHSDWLYLTKEENAAMEWIVKSTPQDSVVLASPSTGLFIPARTGRGVIYGHPFETVNAEENQAAVIRFFQGNPRPEDEKIMSSVNYVFLGPRERALGDHISLTGLDKVYSNPYVTIYQVIR
jgi:hypothetical protein